MNSLKGDHILEIAIRNKILVINLQKAFINYFQSLNANLIQYQGPKTLYSIYSSVFNRILASRLKKNDRHLMEYFSSKIHIYQNCNFYKEKIYQGCMNLKKQIFCLSVLLLILIATSTLQAQEKGPLMMKQELGYTLGGGVFGAGLGIVGITIIAVIKYKQIPNIPTIIGLSFIVIGVVIVHLMNDIKVD